MPIISGAVGGSPRVASSLVYGSVASVADGAAIPFPSVDFDGLGAWNAVTHKFVLPLTGVYLFGLVVAVPTGGGLLAIQAEIDFSPEPNLLSPEAQGVPAGAESAVFAAAHGEGQFSAGDSVGAILHTFGLTPVAVSAASQFYCTYLGSVA